MARILIIEDNPANLELMSYLLKSFGHDIISAVDGAAGIKAAQQQPELIICDIHLPKMDGYQIVRQFKQNPDLKQIPLLAVTALAMVGDRERVLAAGFDGYISKPIEPQTLVKEIEGFLREEGKQEMPST